MDYESELKLTREQLQREIQRRKESEHREQEKDRVIAALSRKISFDPTFKDSEFRLKPPGDSL